MINAKQMLEYYYGHTEHSGAWIEDKDADEVETELFGNKYKPGHWEHETFCPGEIARLSNLAQRIKERSQLGKRFLDRTFSNFEKDRDRDAYDASVAYANDEELFFKRRNGLIYYGTPGSGKTHLAAAIANDFASKGIPVLFGTFVDHLERIRAEFDGGGANDYLNEMENINLLVIDDLGQEKDSEWVRQTLYQVVNRRYERMLPTVITTNLSQDGLANHLGHPVYSRLYEMCGTIEMGASDYRMEH